MTNERSPANRRQQGDSAAESDAPEFDVAGTSAASAPEMESETNPPDTNTTDTSPQPHNSCDTDPALPGKGPAKQKVPSTKKAPTKTFEQNETKVFSGEMGEPLDSRKAAVLRAVVSEHIETGQPVGSSHLSASSGIRVSSATIRNEMSSLEREGYLTHPHTSAGRIPTDRGYRFFVDSIGNTNRLSELKVQKVRQFFDSAHGELEQLMTETSKLLSGLTDYAAVVVAPPVDAATVRSVQVVGLGTGPEHLNAVAVCVLSNGSVEKVHLELPAGSDDHVGAASVYLTAQLSGRPYGSVSNVLTTGDGPTDRVCLAAMKALNAEPLTGEVAGVFVGGASRMASAFDAVDTIRRVLGTLEEQFVVVSLLREALDRSSAVSIGAEHGAAVAFESLLTCSVVAAPYMIDGKSAGAIGVLGPTRMDYPQAMAAVAMISDELTGRLAEG
jgi:heat-inducible transcriptional repressor